MPVQILSRNEGTYPSKQAANQANTQGMINILGSAIQGYTKGREGERLRKAAGELLGVPPESLRGFSNEQLEKMSGEAAIEKFKTSIEPKEYKPKTMGEKLRLEFGPEAQKFEAAKERRKKQDQYTPEQMEKMFGGNIPPGTVMKVGNLTIPLNPKLSQEQAASVAAAKEVEDDVNSFKTLLTKHQGEAGSIAKLTLPYALVGGDTEEMKRITDQLRARIPFAKGGKQLTPFEAKTLFQLLPQPGQSKETINKNLDKFVTEFNKMSEIATKGSAAAITQPQGQPQTNNISDEDIMATAQKYGITPEEVKQKLGVR